MQRMQGSFIKNVKERKESSILFIKNAKERENVAFFWKERKRMQEHCILLKRTHAQLCVLYWICSSLFVVDIDFLVSKAMAQKAPTIPL